MVAYDAKNLTPLPRDTVSSRTPPSVVPLFHLPPSLGEGGEERRISAHRILRAATAACRDTACCRLRRGRRPRKMRAAERPAEQTHVRPHEATNVVKPG